MRANAAHNITEKLGDKTEFFSVDIFRLVFAMEIVALHLSPLKDINNTWNYFLVNVFTRLGVPFFFLVSGFFLQRKIYNSKEVKLYLVKLLKLYLFYTLLYLPQIIYDYIRFRVPLFKGILLFFKDFLLIGSYAQLWYFVALMFSTILLYWLVKIVGLSDKLIAAIVLTLYIIGTIMNAYISPLKESLSNISYSQLATVDLRYIGVTLYFKIFHTTRNGLFFGLPYLFFGYLIAKSKNNIFRKKYFLLSIVSFIAMTVESLVVVKVFDGYGQDMLFSLLPTSVFVFLFILFIDSRTNPQHRKIAKHCRCLSVLYFGFHLCIDFYIRNIVKSISHIELHSMVQFFLVILVTHIIAESIIYMSNISRFQWLKKLY